MEHTEPERLYDFREDWAKQYQESARTKIPGYETLFRIADCLLCRELPDSADVLVVGGGGGEELCSIGRDKNWHMLVIDPSGPMCEGARGRAASIGIADRCEVVEGYVSDLPLGRMHDAATCLLVMHFLPREGQAALLSDLHRRLKPGAPVAMAHLVRNARESENAWMADFWRDFLIRAGVDAEAVEQQRLAREREVTMLTEDEFRHLCADAGFDVLARVSQALHFTQWMLRRRE
ncbi:MAG: class I SAM-dependent methyltransferase [Fibrobacteres bacterium]|nr:class I SAM-dependent methyltransferase [Fibrobacterota bacterium]